MPQRGNKHKRLVLKTTALPHHHDIETRLFRFFCRGPVCRLGGLLLCALGHDVSFS
ncbi:hypothetical protein thalar_00640 [Litoreibacter arenae DSM 19593]|uniref:Uncharacterized protein n=1 Tax=Litoreibacter arenae DSM 19593 TaxID=1123360 RepID=S9QIB3_9RHOB|nr:hypothetical protein thalar_00640 [Litoreibacter arenae DSM 19593]